MAGNSHEATRYFRHSDPKTLKDTEYQAGDAYAGSSVEDNQTSPEGPDGQGPVLKPVAEKAAEKTTPVTSTKENK